MLRAVKMNQTTACPTHKSWKTQKSDKEKKPQNNY